MGAVPGSRGVRDPESDAAGEADHRWAPSNPNRAALVVTGLGLVVGGVVLVRTEGLLPALAALLEMLPAAGLLRLAAAPTLPRALGAGGVLLVRRLATVGCAAICRWLACRWRADSSPACAPRRGP